MRFFQLILIVQIIVPLVSCSSGDAPTLAKQQTGFQGIVLTDPQAHILGYYGSSDLNDWKNDPNMSAAELALLDFEDDMSLNGTSMGEISNLIAYPNPVSYRFEIHFSSNQPVKLKMVLVNENFKILETYSHVGTSFVHNFNIDNLYPSKKKELLAQGISIPFTNVSDENRYHDRSIFRIYYSFSATGAPDFYKGHGDIMICREDCGIF